jgi:thiosulfate dehydrogenase [quinone] large subunit
MEVELAYLMLRLGLGLNILLHGMVRLLHRESFKVAVEKEFENTFLPQNILNVFVFTLPILETIIGFFLSIGLFTEVALVIGTLLIFILMFGKSLKNDWQVVSLQMIYVAFYAGLEFLYEFNSISVDAIFF